MKGIQIFISNNSAGKEKMDFFKKYIDVGDFIGVEGHCFYTRTEELSIEAKDIEILTSLNSLRAISRATTFEARFLEST